MRKCLLIIAAGLLLACEPCKHYNRLQVVAYAGEPTTKKPYGTIRPYLTVEEIGRAYEVIGFMSCEASAADEAAVLKAMLYRAADMGADGVFLNPVGMGASMSGIEQPQATRIDVRVGWAALIGDGNERAYRAQAIRFK